MLLKCHQNEKGEIAQINGSIYITNRGISLDQESNIIWKQNITIWEKEFEQLRHQIFFIYHYFSTQFTIHIRFMQVKRISNFKDSIPKTTPQLRRQESSFKPVTRLQKIHQRDFIYPSTTRDKLILIANLDGSGFRRQKFPDCPPHIALSQMIQSINAVCFEQWEYSKKHYHQHPFARLNLLSNGSLVVAVLLIIVLVLMVTSNNIDHFQGFVNVFLCFLTSLIICGVVSVRKPDEYNADTAMVRCIQSKLSQLNLQEIIRTNNNPQYIWTAHKDCLWIAFRLLKPLLPLQRARSDP